MSVNPCLMKLIPLVIDVRKISSADSRQQLLRTLCWMRKPPLPKRQLQLLSTSQRHQRHRKWRWNRIRSTASPSTKRPFERATSDRRWEPSQTPRTTRNRKRGWVARRIATDAAAVAVAAAKMTRHGWRRQSCGNAIERKLHPQRNNPMRISRKMPRMSGWS